MKTLRFMTIASVLALLCRSVTMNAENLTDIKTGVRYLEQMTLSWRPEVKTYDYGFEIGDTVTIAGKKAYEVWTFDTDSPDDKRLHSYLHIDGTKVYRIGKKGTKYSNSCLLLYDFGLQPGDVMVGYSFDGAPHPDKFIYKCIAIEEDPCYNNCKTMILEAKSTADLKAPEYLGKWSGREDIRWILNYGSERGLMCPFPGRIGVPVPQMMEITDGNKTIFSLYGVTENLPWMR